MKQGSSKAQIKHDVREAIRKIARGDVISIDKAFEQAKEAYREQSCKQ